MTAAQPRARPALATSVAAAVLCVGVVGVTMSPWAPLVKPLAGVLTFCALVAELLGARYAAQLRLSAAFVAGMLAVGFLGPVPAFLIPVIKRQSEQASAGNDARIRQCFIAPVIDKEQRWFLAHGVITERDLRMYRRGAPSRSTCRALRAGK